MRDSWRQRLWRACSDYVALVVVLVVLITYFSLATRHFYSKSTFLVIANLIPHAVIIAVGMTLVLIVGGIDLSVGSVLALAGATLGLCLTRAALPVPVTIAAALGVGLACGALNGFVTVTWRIPSFIVTLGMLEMARGAASYSTGSQTLYLDGALKPIIAHRLFGLSVPFLLALVVVAAGQVLLSRTKLGRHMFAVGGNEEAARLSGVAPRRTKMIVFTLCGLLASLAAVMLTAQSGSAAPTAGRGFELRAIAAVVVGGTSLMGGRGSVVASFLGVLIIEVLDAGLYQKGVDDDAKRIIVGAVIVLAVIADVYRQRLSARLRRGG